MEKILERITAVIAALTVVIIAVSVSHEFGYFAYIGGSFLQTFVSASDYFTNAILWLPVAAITIVGWWSWPSLLSDPPKPNIRDWKSWIVPVVLVGLPVASFFVLREGYPIFYLLMVEYLWLLSFEKFVPQGKPEIPYSIEARTLLKLSGAVSAAMFTLGYINADSDFSSANNSIYIVHTKDAGDLNRILLRNFEKGILVRDPTKDRIDVILWGGIRSLEKTVSPKSKQSLVCGWFKILCKL
jgi:hypothetical protein